MLRPWRTLPCVSTGRSIILVQSAVVITDMSGSSKGYLTSCKYISLFQGLLVALQNASEKSLIVVFTDNGSKDLKLEKEINRLEPGLGIYKRKKEITQENMHENTHENKKIVYECMFACMFSCPISGSIEWCYMTECRQCISLRTAVFHHSMIDFNHNLCICAFHVFSLVDFH